MTKKKASQKTSRSETVILRVDPKYKEELAAYATSNNVSMSEATRRMTKWYMRNMVSLVDDIEL